ncbi:PAS domain-containing protein [Alphaproteobacteria bacterium GH1-50]|uniref:PAS domain-containing protein n=1 Tax=Kangsaoukella pontilimi TaxID=2691042 RepID=A0A7C9IE53_9RHOB|nr:PAS domain-containing protein [Kangsaoukella pontilimi]MXQ06484.1 PAS domain-containing protein [Kangsaoukella pontilimi]
MEVLDPTDGEGNMPTKLEPTFSLAFFRRCLDGAVILNSDGRVGFINDAACSSLGLKGLGDVVQRRWTELWPEEAEEPLTEGMRRVLSGDAVRLAGLQAKSGKFDMLMSPIMNKDGQVESLLAVLFPSGAEPRISG